MALKQIDIEALKTKIYDTLIAMPEMGLGEMGECRDEADRIVDEWLEENEINLVVEEEI